MRSSVLRIALALAFASTLVPATAQAIPLFAQRYRLTCGTCHSVLPELNQFGVSFREHGYRLDLPKHGTTGIALRYQLEYEQTPPSNQRRYSPGGVLLSNADFGAITAFVHYNLGAGGGPSGLFLGYLAMYNKHTNSLYRAGLIELPLAQSPGQRLDDLAPYGYYTQHVGLNDLTLASPRWGIQDDRLVGATHVNLVADMGEFKGAAYGGAPVPTGETTSAHSPELSLWATGPVTNYLDIGATAMTGDRSIVPTGQTGFTDSYRRYGVLAHSRVKRFDFQAEQWWGNDSNVDGSGTTQGSSGGYARLKYYVTQHAYLGVRYDTAAAPSITRDIVYYAAFHVTPHVRLILQDVHPIGALPAEQFGGALTVGFPWPANL